MNNNNQQYASSTFLSSKKIMINDTHQVKTHRYFQALKTHKFLK